MKKLYLLILLQAPALLFAQSLVGGWIETGIPTGDFRQNTDAFGLGLGAGFYASLDPDGFAYLGAEMDYEIYGKNIETDGVFELITNNNMLQLHGVLRLMPPTGGVTPIIEGLFGFKYLYTVDKVKEDILTSALEQRLVFHDIALSYGVSFGFRFPTGSSDEGGGVEFRVQYLLGGGAEYIDAKSIRQNGFDSAIANPINSETDMVVIKLGYTIRL